MNASVRLATPADAATLGQMLADFNAEFDEWCPPFEELAAHFARILGPTAFAFLAHAGEEAVGFAFLTLRPSPYYPGPVAQLDELYVAPAQRGKGIGTRLLTAFVEEAMARGAREMHINVDEIDVDARRFYERHGYVNVEPGKDYRMLCYIREFDV